MYFSPSLLSLHFCILFFHLYMFLFLLIMDVYGCKKIVICCWLSVLISSCPILDPGTLHMLT